MYNSGIKISKIAKWEFEELQTSVREYISKNDSEQYHLDSLKLAMFNFDQGKFERTFNQLLAQDSFKNVFIKIFIPWLHVIGLLWQSNTILPVHENFISNLIKQKLLINIEKVQQIQSEAKKSTFVLFLPSGEVHELGLLYIHYELLIKGYHSIYLGQSVPTSNLKEITNIYPKANFIGYFTVSPETDSMTNYFEKLNSILNEKGKQLWILGRKIHDLEINKSWNFIKKFDDIENLVKFL